MRQHGVEERVQPQSRTQGPERPKQPPTAADRLDRLEHDVRELQDQFRRLSNEVAGLQSLVA